MANHNTLRAIAALAIATAILWGQPKAGAVLVGITPGGPHTALIVNADATTAAGFTNSWTVGSEQAPISIDYLATNGLWLNDLTGSQPLVVGQMIQLHEYIKIGDGGPSWVNWNQKFVTEGFNFMNGTLKVSGNLVTNGIVSLPDHNTINFFFSALPAGTVLEITKNIQWAGTAGGDFANVFQGAPDLIELEQFPTVSTNDVTPPVPEPASLSMVGLALSLMGAGGKFAGRKKRIRS